MTAVMRDPVSRASRTFIHVGREVRGFSDVEAQRHRTRSGMTTRPGRVTTSTFAMWKYL